jgi:hypothetical protein
MLLFAVAGSFVLGAWAASDPPKPEKAADEPFHKELLKIATEYKAWGRVDDEMRWAPVDCRLPNPGQAKFSESKDEKTHGQKLYSLFARRHEDYLKLEKNAAVRVDQVVVKQSWIPEEITEEKDKPSRQIDQKRVVITKNPETKPERESVFDRDMAFDRNDRFYPYVWKGDKVFKASKQADLFIMMKLDAKTPGTDEGWVYATVTPDGKKVTAAGKIESCMKCHQDAKYDRLFGLKEKQ